MLSSHFQLQDSSRRRRNMALIFILFPAGQFFPENPNNSPDFPWFHHKSDTGQKQRKGKFSPSKDSLSTGHFISQSQCQQIVWPIISSFVQGTDHIIIYVFNCQLQVHFWNKKWIQTITICIESRQEKSLLD